MKRALMVLLLPAMAGAWFAVGCAAPEQSMRQCSQPAKAQNEEWQSVTGSCMSPKDVAGMYSKTTIIGLSSRLLELYEDGRFQYARVECTASIVARGRFSVENGCVRLVAEESEQGFDDHESEYCCAVSGQERYLVPPGEMDAFGERNLRGNFRTREYAEWYFHHYADIVPR